MPAGEIFRPSGLGAAAAGLGLQETCRDGPAESQAGRPWRIRGGSGTKAVPADRRLKPVSYARALLFWIRQAPGTLRNGLWRTAAVGSAVAGWRQGAGKARMNREERRDEGPKPPYQHLRSGAGRRRHTNVATEKAPGAEPAIARRTRCGWVRIAHRLVEKITTAMERPVRLCWKAKFWSQVTRISKSAFLGLVEQ